ncbi:MAG TPA: DUF4349 domain-containing protein [Candidatus Baltobacteraceae bacterium]|nr:DUF4349 domain-containing protein [Candidatus Baltobacteraceae bacterium]
MTNLVAYFKQRPKTALGLLAISLVLTAGWFWSQNAASPSFRQESSAVGVSQDAYYYGGGSAGMPGKAVSPMAPPTTDNSRMMYPVPQPTAGETAAETDQKIIKNGYLRMVVDEVAPAASEIGRMAVARGGFIQNSSVTERGDGTYVGDVTVRVPVSAFEAAMTEIKTLANVVKSETASGQDVTEQYTDLEAQLRNAKAQEEVYLEILKQAKTVEDILLVQDRLGNIRAVIESLEGRIKFLENATSYSTINVSLEEEPVVRAPTKEFRLGAIVRDAVQTLVNALQYLAASLVYAVIVWGGILLPVGLLAWIAWKIWKRRAMR